MCGNFHEELHKFKLTNQPIQETPEENKARSVAYSAKKLRTPLFEGVKELLEKIYALGYILTINTSALERNCLPLLEYSGVAKLFDFVATAEVSKSKVEKFKIIEEKYGVKKKDMLFVTDTLGDIREADVAHVPTVAVTWGAHNKIHFTREPHENLVAILDSVSELESFIKNRQSSLAALT